MGQRDYKNGESNSRRQMTPFSEYKRRYKITNDLPPEEKMKKLTALFDALANCAHHYAENLQPGAVERRITKDDGVSSSPEEMQLFLEEDAHTIRLMHDCLVEMRDNPLSRINGTSCEFARCTQILAHEKALFITGRKALFRVMHAASAANDRQSASDCHPAVA